MKFFGLKHKPEEKTARKLYSKSPFFRAAKIFTGALLASFLISIAAPKTAYSQESIRLENGILKITSNGVITQTIDVRDSLYKYGGSRELSDSDLIFPQVLWEMPKYGTAHGFVFPPCGFGYFPDAPESLRLRFFSSPGKKPFFRDPLIFNDGTFLILSPEGMAGLRCNFRFSISFSSLFPGVPDLSDPSKERVDSLDAYYVRDPEAMGKGVRLRITSDAKQDDGIHLKVEADETAVRASSAQVKKVK